MNELKQKDRIPKLELQLDLEDLLPPLEKSLEPAEGGVSVSEGRGTGPPIHDPSRDGYEW